MARLGGGLVVWHDEDVVDGAQAAGDGAGCIVGAVHGEDVIVEATHQELVDVDDVAVQHLRVRHLEAVQLRRPCDGDAAGVDFEVVLAGEEVQGERCGDLLDVSAWAGRRWVRGMHDSQKAGGLGLRDVHRVGVRHVGGLRLVAVDVGVDFLLGIHV